jgi:hypothetical protein
METQLNPSHLFTWWSSLLAIGYPGFIPGVKGMGCEVDQSPPSNFEVKNEWRCNSLPPLRHHGVDRDKFTSSVADSTASWPTTRSPHGIYVITQIRRLLLCTTRSHFFI